MAYADAVLADSPLIYNQYDGDSVVNTGSIAENPATPYGIVYTQGIKGRAVQGTTGDRTLYSHTDNYFAGNWTVEAWIKRPPTAATSYLISRSGSSGRVLFGIDTSNRLFLTFGTGTDEKTLTYATALDSEWHHVVGRKGATGFMSLYVDGVEVATTTNPAGGSTSIGSYLSLGGRDDGFGSFLGVYDEVAIYGAELSSARIQAHYNAMLESYSSLVLLDGPILYNTMDAVALNDADAVQGGDWAIAGATKVEGGIQGTRCLNWDGTNRGNSPATYSFNLGSGGVTAECWLKSTDTNGTIMQVSSSAGTNLVGHFRVYLSSGSVYFQRHAQAAYLGNPAVTVNDNAWHHIAVTWNRATGSLRHYVDGVEIYTTTTPVETTGNTSYVYVGGDRHITATYTGLQDEVAVYTKVLTPARILAHFNAGDPDAPEPPPVVVYYKGWGIPAR